MNPPSIWPRSTIGETRIAHVFEDVGAQQAIVAGEPVHFHFGNRGAIREIVKGLAPSSLADRNECRAFGSSLARTEAPAGDKPLRKPSRTGWRDAPRPWGTRGHRKNALRRVRTRAARPRPAPVRLQAGCTHRPPPRRSNPLPADAAVADVLGILSVRVGITRTLSSSRPRLSAAICWIFVCSPWPISVPP